MSFTQMLGVIRMKAKLSILTLFIILSGCKNQAEKKSEVDTEKEMSIVNKWVNQGECFENLKNYNPSEEYELVKHNIYKKKSDSSFYFLTCRYDGLAYLNQLSEAIDVESLNDYGEFWTDKNFVYYEYLISDGVQFYRLDTADRATFESFGKTIYAKDKNHIYDSRHGIIKEADLESFRPIAINKETGTSAYGKDKNNYFFWNEIVQDTIELKKHLKIE